MIITLIACAVLCALACIWVLAPVTQRTHFFAVAFTCAVITLGLYLGMGRPDLPAAPTPYDAQKADYIRKEAQFMIALKKNPDDVDSLVRLAALRLLQGRGGPETTQLLERADTIKPGDSRVRVMRSMLNYPSPE